MECQRHWQINNLNLDANKLKQLWRESDKSKSNILMVVFNKEGKFLNDQAEVLNIWSQI